MALDTRENATLSRLGVLAAGVTAALLVVALTSPAASAQPLGGVTNSVDGALNNAGPTADELPGVELPAPPAAPSPPPDVKPAPIHAPAAPAVPIGSPGEEPPSSPASETGPLPQAGHSSLTPSEGTPLPVIAAGGSAPTSGAASGADRPDADGSSARSPSRPAIAGNEVARLLSWVARVWPAIAIEASLRPAGLASRTAHPPGIGPVAAPLLGVPEAPPLPAAGVRRRESSGRHPDDAGSHGLPSFPPAGSGPGLTTVFFVLGGLWVLVVAAGAGVSRRRRLL
jgi:hypothetical protein